MVTFSADGAQGRLHDQGDIMADDDDVQRAILLSLMSDKNDIAEDAAMVVQRAEEACVEPQMKNKHGDNLLALGKRVEQWLMEFEPSTIGRDIVERLKFDAAGDEARYCAWCIQAKEEIEVLHDKAEASAREPRLKAQAAKNNSREKSESARQFQDEAAKHPVDQELPDAHAFKAKLVLSIVEKAETLAHEAAAKAPAGHPIALLLAQAAKEKSALARRFQHVVSKYSFDQELSDTPAFKAELVFALAEKDAACADAGILTDSVTLPNTRNSQRDGYRIFQRITEALQRRKSNCLQEDLGTIEVMDEPTLVNRTQEGDRKAAATTPGIRCTVTCATAVATMPPNGLLIVIPENVPLQLLVERVAERVQVPEDTVQLAYEGKSLDPGLSLQQHTNIVLPIHRRRGTSEIPICLFTSGIPRLMQKALEDAKALEDYWMYPSQCLDEIVSTNFFGKADALKHIREPTKYDVTNTDGRWFEELCTKVREIVPNCSHNDLQDVLSNNVMLTSNTDELLTVSELSEKKGSDLAACFPMIVHYVPSIAHIPGQRSAMKKDARCEIEKMMNGIAKRKHFSVLTVLNNTNHEILQQYTNFKAHLETQLANGKSMRRRSQPKTREFSENAELNPDINEFMLFHGTSIENAARITGASFKLGHARQGAYGKGIYFADNPMKSDQYAATKHDDALGPIHVMLLCRVACGKVLEVNSTGDYEDRIIGSDASDDSVNGTNFFHNEFIIFREEQCYPEFVILYQKV
jgi:hypothetical protein